MANDEHVALLKQGVNVWNKSREEMNLRWANLSEANLSEAELSDLQLTLRGLSGTNRAGFIAGYLNYHKEEANLSGADLSGMDLSNANLGGANLGGANLSGTLLGSTDLSGADLRGANLNGVKNLSKADLRKANLGNADLRGMDLSKADLSGGNADLRGMDLSGANLSGASLPGARLNAANLREANLRGTNLRRAILIRADLSEANLSGASLGQANLSNADLRVAHLIGARLNGANLREANLGEANLSGAELSGAMLLDTDLAGADLTGCRIYGVSAWGLKLDGATQQKNLIITPDNEPEITVDNIEVAQFIYLMLHNEKIRDVIDTIGKKAVLILGRFTNERKAVLDALREELRKRNYLPILFDFAVPATRDITETVSLLARMARFIVADLTDPSSIPKELEAIVPQLAVPVQPLLEGASRPYAMFKDYWKYDWVLPVYRYEGLGPLLATLADKVIAPAEGKVRALQERRRMIEAELTKPR